MGSLPTLVVVVIAALAVGLSVTLSYYKKEQDTDTRAVREAFDERASKVGVKAQAAQQQAVRQMCCARYGCCPDD
jgi:hypothetical protein